MYEIHMWLEKDGGDGEHAGKLCIGVSCSVSVSQPNQPGAQRWCARAYYEYGDPALPSAFTPRKCRTW